MIAAGPTAPFRIRCTGTRIDDLNDDGGSIAGVAWFVLGAVLLSADQLEAFAATQVIVVVTGQIRPELRVVVALRSREITVQCRIRGITTKIWICFAERVALLGIARVEFIRRRAQAVEAECTGTGSR